MNQFLILPEMLEAGEQALAESRAMELPERQMLCEIYLAMEGMKEIVIARANGMAVH